MNYSLTQLLACPVTKQSLLLQDAKEKEGEVESGVLATPDGKNTYPITNFVPRFVSSQNYASNFGMQWNRFARTQLDSHTGLPLSRDRLLMSLGCGAEELTGKRILDVGCGAGRFVEAALAAGANVVALDYSTAVDAAWRSNGPNPNLDVVQASIYELPFALEQFDYVYCLGVLQHTPDVRAAFMSLPSQVKPGGLLAVDVYARVFLNWLWPKYWLRPVLKRMPQPRLMTLVESGVKYLLPLSMAISKIPVVGRRLRYAVPVSNHAPDWPQLTPAQVHEWAVLNTFDMFSPQHDHPQSDTTLRAWFQEAGFQNVEVFRSGFYVGRGRKPSRASRQE